MLNGLIERLAVKSGTAQGGCEYYADKIIALIEVKQNLAALWERLDKVIAAMTDRDKAALKAYAWKRGASDGEKRELHRAVVKFGRRAANILKGGKELYKNLCAYACLLSPAPD